MVVVVVVVLLLGVSLSPLKKNILLNPCHDLRLNPTSKNININTTTITTVIRGLIWF